MHAKSKILNKENLLPARDRLNSHGKSARVDLGVGDLAKFKKDKHKRSSLATLKI